MKKYFFIFICFPFCINIAYTQTAFVCGTVNNNGSAQSLNGSVPTKTSGQGNGPIRALVIFAQFSDDNYEPYNPASNDPWQVGQLPVWADNLLTPLIKSGSGTVSNGTTFTDPSGSFSSSDQYRRIYIANQLNIISSVTSATTITLQNSSSQTGTLNYEVYDDPSIAKYKGDITDFYDLMSLEQEHIVGEHAPQLMITDDGTNGTINKTEKWYVDQGEDLSNATEDIIKKLDLSNFDWSKYDNWNGLTYQPKTDKVVDLIIVLWRHLSTDIYPGTNKSIAWYLTDGPSYGPYSGVTCAFGYTSVQTPSYTIGGGCNGIIVRDEILHQCDMSSNHNYLDPNNLNSVPDVSLYHEIGHSLGWQHEQSNPNTEPGPTYKGIFGLMCGGSDYSAWERTVSGWITPAVVPLSKNSIGNTYTLQDFSSRTQNANEYLALEIPIPNTNPREYYELENHQGLYAIDKLSHSYTQNEINYGNTDYDNKTKCVTGLWMQRVTDNYLVRYYPANGFWDWNAITYKQSPANSTNCTDCWGNYYNNNYLLYGRAKSDPLSGYSDYDNVVDGTNTLNNTLSTLPKINGTIAVNYQHPPRNYDADPDDYIAGFGIKGNFTDHCPGHPHCGHRNDGSKEDPFDGVNKKWFTDYTNPPVMDPSADTDPNNPGLGFEITSVDNSTGSITVQIVSAKSANYLPPVQNVQAVINTGGCGINITWDQSTQDSPTGTVTYNVYRSINGGADQLLTSSPINYGTYSDNTVSSATFDNGLNYVKYSVIAKENGYTDATESDYSESVGVLYGTFSTTSNPPIPPATTYYYTGNSLLIIDNPTIHPIIASGASLTLANAPIVVQFCNNSSTLTVNGALTIDNKDFNQGSAILNGNLVIANGGAFSIAENAAINLNCNVTVSGAWGIADGATVGLNYNNSFNVSTNANLTINGVSANHAVFNVIGGTAVGAEINCGTAGSIAAQYADFTNVWMRFKTCGITSVSNCTFTNAQSWGMTQFLNGTPTTFGFLDIYNPNGPVTINTNTFTGNNGFDAGAAVAINDNVSMQYAPLVENNTIKKFMNGIRDWASPTQIFTNTLTDCLVGINAIGSTNASIYNLNSISAPVNIGLLPLGIYCQSASPLIMRSTISSEVMGVAINLMSSPPLYCNKITGCTQYGVSLQEGSIAYMHLGWGGDNYIANNALSQIYSVTAPPATVLSVPVLQCGDNVIEENGGSLLGGAPAVVSIPIPCLTPSKSLLNGKIGLLDAEGNWWGNDNPVCPQANPPNGTTTPEQKSTIGAFYDCPTAANGSNAAPNCPSGPAPGGIQWDAHSYPWTENCSLFPEPNYSELSTDPCSFWLEKYDHAISCTSCDSAVLFLQNAVCACSGDPSSDVQLISLLQKILETTVVCNGRDYAHLQAIGLWFDGLSHNQPCPVSPFVQRAAKFEEAETYGVAQYFDNASAIFDSLGATAMDSIEHAGDSTFSAMMKQFKAVEGENTGGLWKKLAYAGRAGYVAVTENPLFLETYPNPFNPVAQISFTIPDEDASDVTEVKVFDMMARDVTTLVKDIEPAGRHTITFNASALPSGQYIVAVHTLNHMQSKLIILTK